MSGDRSKTPSAGMPTGRRIATVTGVGFRHMAGRGLTTSLGVGRLIITDAGFTTTGFGFGRRMDIKNTGAVGGSPRSSYWQPGAVMFAGIRCRIITVITITTGIIVVIVKITRR